jgi:hypothetical protein
MARRSSGGPAAAIQVDGLRRLRRDLRKAGESTEDLKEANAAVAALVAAASSARAPRRSGKLASSGRGNRAVGRATVVFGGAAVPYAGPIHWGWPAHGIEPQTFIPDAAQATEPVWLELYLAGVDKALEPLQGTTY